MFPRMTLKGVSTAFVALGLALAAGSLPLQIGCGGKSAQDNDTPAPAITSFLVARTASTFGPATNTLSISSGDPVFIQGNFSTLGGSAVITPGNHTVRSGEIVSLGAITAATEYTLTVTNSAGIKTQAKAYVVIAGLADTTITTSLGTDTSVTLGSTGLTASVPTQVGCTYAWSLAPGTNGTITSPTTSAPAITFNVASNAALVGSAVNLTCVVTNAALVPSTGTKSLIIKDYAPTALSYPALTLNNNVPMASPALPTVSGVSRLDLVSFALVGSAGLPNGLVLNPNGSITGTPNESGLPKVFTPVIRATNTGGYADYTLTITVDPPAVTLAASQATIGLGATTSLNWTVDASVTSFTINNGVQTAPFTPPAGVFSGSYIVSPTATTTYTLTAQPGNFTTSAAVTVDSNPVAIAWFGTSSSQSSSVVLPGATQAPLAWNLGSTYPALQEIRSASGTVLATPGNSLRAFNLDGSYPLSYGRQVVSLQASNTSNSSPASKNATIAVKALNVLLGHTGGKGTFDGTFDSTNGSSARLNSPGQLGRDTAGNLYVLETYNYTIRKITPSGTVTTIAGTAGKTGNAQGTTTLLNTPRAMAVSQDGNTIFVADTSNTQIVKLVKSGSDYVSSVVTYTGPMPTAINANGLALDEAANALYVLEYQTTTTPNMPGLYKLNLADNTTTTIATGMLRISHLTRAFDGKLYYTQTDNALGHKVMMVDPSLATPVTPVTVAGTAYVSTSAATANFIDGSATTTAKLYTPAAVCVDASGNIYIADKNSAVRVIPVAGAYAGNVVTIVGGRPTAPAAGYSIGSYAIGAADNLSTARLNQPTGLWVTGDGKTGTEIFVSDTSNDIVRKIVVSNAPSGPDTGATYTIDDPILPGVCFAGAPKLAGATDSPARFNNPYAITVDASGNAYVADSANHTIRMITPAGVVSTIGGIAGTASSINGVIGTSTFNAPQGIVVDGTNLYVAENGAHTIRKIDLAFPNYVVTTIAGTAGTSGTADGATGTFKYPQGLAIQLDNSTTPATKYLLVADAGNYRIRRINLSAGNAVSTLAGSSTGFADGTTWTGATAGTAFFKSPYGIAVDTTTGAIYVSDNGNSAIRKILGGQVTTIGGQPGATSPYTPATGFMDGNNLTSRFNATRGIAIDVDGNLYVADYNNNAIRVISPAGITSTIAGFGSLGFGTRPGLLVPDGAQTGNGGLLYQPHGLAVTPSGDLIANSANAIVQITAPANK